MLDHKRLMLMSKYHNDILYQQLGTEELINIRPYRGFMLIRPL